MMCDMEARVVTSLLGKRGGKGGDTSFSRGRTHGRLFEFSDVFGAYIDVILCRHNRHIIIYALHLFALPKSGEGPFNEELREHQIISAHLLQQVILMHIVHAADVNFCSVTWKCKPRMLFSWLEKYRCHWDKSMSCPFKNETLFLSQ